MTNNEQKINNKDIIFQMINATIKHRRVMQSFLEDSGVFHAQHRLLMAVARNPNISQIEVAKSMDISSATVAVSLKKLEKGGYIKREVVPEDNRLNHITLTDKGTMVVEQSKKIFEFVDQSVFKGFNDEEKNTIYGLLQRIDRNLSSLEEEIKFKKERN